MVRRFFIISLMLAACALNARHAKQIVLFGDSCSDCGNMPPLQIRNNSLTRNFVLPAASFSNGPTWIVKLGNLWKTTVEASSRGGLNYAFVNAQTSIDNIPSTFASLVPAGAALVPPTTTLPFATSNTFVPSLRTQMNEFLTQRKDVSQDAIIFQYGGVNNYLQNRPTTSAKSIGTSGAADLVANAVTLSNAGFRNQVICTTQNKTLVLGIPAADFAVFGDTLNASLIQGLKNTGQHPVLIDINSFWNDLYANTAFYGFTGTGGNDLYPAQSVRGYGPMQTMTGPNNTILWFEDVHFSELVQNHFSQYVHNLLEAPAYWGHIARQPFAMARGQNAMVRQELYPLSHFCVKSVHPFVSATYIPQERVSFVEGKVPTARGWNAIAGLAYQCTQAWTIGFAGGYNRNNFVERDVLGCYTARLGSFIASFFSGMHVGRGYFNGIFNVGKIWLCNNRNFPMGPQQWCAKGNTHGMQYDLLLEGAGHFYQNDFARLGPVMTIEYQHVGLNGYCEQNASYNNVQYCRQRANSFVTGIGLETVLWGSQTTCLHNFLMELSIQVNEDWIGGKRMVYFRQQSLDDAPYGQWPVYQKRSTYGSFGVNIRKTFADRVTLHAGYRGNWGQRHMSEQNLMLNLTVDFD